MHTKLFKPALLLLFALLTGCVTTGKKDDGAAIDERAVKRWEYLIARQAEKAYDYLSPGYRKTKTREAYAAEMNNRPVRWKSVKFLDRQCEDEACDVRLEVGYMLALGAMMPRDVETKSPVRERWVKSGRHWYYLPNERVKIKKEGKVKETGDQEEEIAK